MEPTDWFKIEKGLFNPLFNLYTVHIMRNAKLDELQAVINNLSWERHQQPQICR